MKARSTATTDKKLLAEAIAWFVIYSTQESKAQFLESSYCACFGWVINDDFRGECSPPFFFVYSFRLIFIVARMLIFLW